MKLEGGSGTHNDIIFYRNVFVNSSAWGFCINGAGNVHMINNTIYNMSCHGIGFSSISGNCPSGTLKNNIIEYSSTGYWAEIGSNINCGYNLTYRCKNLPGIKNQTGLLSRNPFFILGSFIYNPSLSDILVNDGIAFTVDDGLNLRSNSCAINAGENYANIGAY